MTITRKLDRIPSKPDPVRLERFAIRELVPDKAPRSYTWSCSVHLNQGQEGACVGHGCIHEAIAKPDVWNFADHGLKLPPGFHPDDQQMAFDLYEWCKRNDEYPGENYDGTSVVTGVKGLQMLGVIGEYRWAANLDDALTGISWHGPAIFGTDWWTGMFEVDRHGFVHMTGKIEGGHCILIKGVSLKMQAVRLHNSWGPDWGKGGDCWLSFTDFGALIQAGAEVCIPVVRNAERVSTHA